MNKNVQNKKLHFRHKRIYIKGHDVIHEDIIKRETGSFLKENIKKSDADFEIYTANLEDFIKNRIGVENKDFIKNRMGITYEKLKIITPPRIDIKNVCACMYLPSMKNQRK